MEEECDKGAKEGGFSNVSIDSTLLIAYPNAFVFMVNKHNRLLLKALELGFERAMADGTCSVCCNSDFLPPG